MFPLFSAWFIKVLCFYYLIVWCIFLLQKIGSKASLNKSAESSLLLNDILNRLNNSGSIQKKLISAALTNSHFKGSNEGGN